MQLVDCNKCGSENSATAAECYDCGKPLDKKWACETDPDEGTIILTLKSGDNEFHITLIPAEAARLAKDLKGLVYDAQLDRCTSQDSPECDEWPRDQDYERPATKEAIKKLLDAAGDLAVEGINPTVKLAMAELAPEVAANIE